MIQHYLGEEYSTLQKDDYKYLGLETAGYSGSDIRNFVSEGAMVPVDKMMEVKRFRITDQIEK